MLPLLFRTTVLRGNLGLSSTKGVRPGHWETRPKHAYLPEDLFMRLRYLLAIALAIPAILPIVWMSAIMIMALVRGPVSSCPKCMQKRIRRSKPRVSDRFFLAWVLPRRCESCKCRFYSPRSSAEHARRDKISHTLAPSGR